MPSLSDLEEFIEENLPRNLQELPHKVAVTVQEYYEVLYEQLTKYGPPIPNLPALPSLPESLTGKVQTALSIEPPPPPPPPPTTYEVAHRWIRDHKRSLAIAGGLVVLGYGTRFAYLSGALWLPGLGRKQVSSRRSVRQVRFKNGVRREAVIVLGGDTPLGRAMALHFSGLGFIVLASVSSSAALSQFEAHIPPSSRGYVKALVYDTADPSGSLQPFIRALSAALSLRYPLTSAGDPYARPGENINITGVINALGFVSPEDESVSASRSLSASSSFAGLGALPMSKLTPSPTSELLDKHVVSGLCALGALLPVLRALPNRSEAEDDLFPATVVTLVSSPASRTSLPRQGVLSIVAQAVAAGAQSLRRECEEDSFNSKAGNKVASNAGGSSSGRRQSREGSKPSLRQRDVRVTVVEVNSGSLWGEQTQSASSDPLTTPTASTTENASSRPSLERSASSSTNLSSSIWHHRSPASAPALNKVSDLLLSTKRRLRPTYTVGTHTMSAYWLSFSHTIFSILPTSVVDIALVLRRQLSLRRAGLIGRAEHAFLPWSWNRQSPARSASRSEQQSRPIAGPGPGPASNAHSRASLSASQLRRSTAGTASTGGYDIRDSDAASLPESEKSTGSGSGSGLPSSVPSSTYGDNDDGDDRSVATHSPFLASSQHSLESGTSELRGSSGTDPWLGPPSRDAPSPSLSGSVHAAGRERGTDSPLGASWVALGESQRAEKRED